MGLWAGRFLAPGSAAVPLLQASEIPGYPTGHPFMQQQLERHGGPKEETFYFPGPFWQKPRSEQNTTTTLQALGRRLRKLIFSYNFALLFTTIATIIVRFTICFTMCRAVQIKQETPRATDSSDKLRFSLIAEEKPELHVEAKSTYCMFTLTSSGVRNDHKTLLESVASSFSQEVDMESIVKKFWN